MGNKQGKWVPQEKEQKQSRCPLKKGTGEATAESYAGKPATQDASVQAEESPAPLETMQGGDPTNLQESQEAPPVPQNLGVQSVGQKMKEQGSQDRASNIKMLATAEDEGDEMPDTTTGYYVAQVARASAVMDNGVNAREEAQMEESP